MHPCICMKLHASLSNAKDKNIFFFETKAYHLLLNKISILEQNFSSYWRNIFHPIHILRNIPSKSG